MRRRSSRPPAVWAPLACGSVFCRFCRSCNPYLQTLLQWAVCGCRTGVRFGTVGNRETERAGPDRILFVLTETKIVRPNSTMISSLLHDMRYGIRTLARNPGFAAVSVLALALGIGANSAIFTVVNSVLLRPLRYEKPEQLVVVRERNLKAGFPQFSLSPGNYLGYRDRNHTFSGIAAFTGQGLNLSGGVEPERLRG